MNNMQHLRELCSGYTKLPTKNIPNENKPLVKQPKRKPILVMCGDVLEDSEEEEEMHNAYKG